MGTPGCHVALTKNNAITQGFHRKMKLIQRRAYGRAFLRHRLDETDDRLLRRCRWFETEERQESKGY